MVKRKGIATSSHICVFDYFRVPETKTLRPATHLANRIFRGRMNDSSSTKPVVLVAITGIALGVMAMILSVMIVMGFRNQITGKVTGFMAHIRIHKFDTNNSFEEEPVKLTQEFVSKIAAMPEVKRVQPYAYKACIMQSKDEIQGIVLKGFHNSSDLSYFSSKLVAGHMPVMNDSVNTEVLVSKTTAQKLQLKAGDSFLVYFIQKDRKVRKLTATGIYNTGLSEEFDNLYLLCNLSLIQRVNNWDNDQAGGYEVFLKSIDDLPTVAPKVYASAGFAFNTQTIQEQYPQLFNWLELQNLNMVVILSLISLIAGITMISTLLILVLENTKTIGLLKAIGARDSMISMVFLQIAIRILLRGLFWGNVLALTAGYLQSTFGFLSLPEESYYLSQVPIEINAPAILLINTGTLLICGLMLLIPSRLISKLSPVRVLRYE